MDHPSSTNRDSASKSRSRQREVPKRFQVDTRTLLFDRFMSHAIKIGGIGVIAAIAAIFIFLVYQILPLFRGATVEPHYSVDLEDIEVGAIGIDPWGELPLLVSYDGTLNFLDIVDRDSEHNRGIFQLVPDFPADVEFSFARYSPGREFVILGTDDGRASVINVDYTREFPDYREQVVVPQIETIPLFRIGKEEGTFEAMDYVEAGRSIMAVAAQRDTDGHRKLFAVTFNRTRPLIGDPVTQRDREFELTDLFEGEAQFILLTGDTDFIIVGTLEGYLHLLAREGERFTRRQSLRPFGESVDQTIASMDFLSGDLSVILTNPDGENLMYSIFHSEEKGYRVLGLTKAFPDLPNRKGAEFYSSTNRNKAFLIGADRFAMIRYATSEATRWQDDLPFRVRLALMGPRYRTMLFLDDENQLHLYSIDDPHPEAGWKAYFGKIHYEGRDSPEFMWQSDGDDDFEPKLSMVPLIWGSLKGTVFAMFIAVPIALLSALYTSQFIKPELRRVIKPVMEIMESVPTVVLGFLAALWLAPIISGRIPSTLLVLVSLPLSAITFGAIMAHLPYSARRYVKSGWEFLYYFPVAICIAYLAWLMGPVLEGLLFTVQNPLTGEIVADFRLWWSDVTGESFRQRNAFVVGIFMGFAIIPTIFTIAEDSMNNVPKSFRSGALALGASRWQTAVSVILPTAAAGIFSAIMIGFGRAVGETMILLMATGNTPIMTINPFDGMRTLAANIAVELPEAARGGTLYRSLFLGALLLFAFTFIINTVAELMRQRLRDRYKAVE